MVFCTGPIKYIGQAHYQEDIANLKAALAGNTSVEQVTLDLTSSVTDPGADTFTYQWTVVTDNGDVIPAGTGAAYCWISTSWKTRSSAPPTGRRWRWAPAGPG